MTSAAETLTVAHTTLLYYYYDYDYYSVPLLLAAVTCKRTKYRKSSFRVLAYSIVLHLCLGTIVRALCCQNFQEQKENCDPVH